MNGGGRYRKVRWMELVAVQNPQRLHARQGRSAARKIQSELHGDMQSQAEMTWPSRICAGVTKLSVPIHHGRWKLERSRS